MERAKLRLGGGAEAVNHEGGEERGRTCVCVHRGMVTNSLPAVRLPFSFQLTCTCRTGSLRSHTASYGLRGEPHDRGGTGSRSTVCWERRAHARGGGQVEQTAREYKQTRNNSHTRTAQHLRCVKSGDLLLLAETVSPDYAFRAVLAGQVELPLIARGYQAAEA